jgi:hypothetical protein
MTDKRSEYKKKWYEANKTRLLKKQNEYNKAHKESIVAYQKEYNEAHKEEAALARQKYYAENKDQIIKKNQKRDLARRAIDPAYKLRRNCSTMIWQSLKGNKNNQSILSYLPYTMKELKVHLESKFDQNMSWSNYGTYWHIDHIIPQSNFVYTSMADENFQKCWVLDNLQPLEAIENIRKSNKLS